MYDEFFSKASELIRQGVPFATAIVVRAERPTSGKPGDKAIITADGTMHGWIGGSCAQPTVIREALKALRADESRFVRLSPNPLEQPPREGLADVAMTCFSGGTLEIYIEPQQPQPRLIVIGNLPVARALAQLGQAMSYHTIVVDPGHQGEPPAYADELLTDVTAIAAHVSPLTSIVVATHGQYDELALEQALATPAPYIGLVASRKRAATVVEMLRDRGVSRERLDRFKAPAGLDIGATTPEEIAVSVLAEIIHVRHTRKAEAVEAPTFVPMSTIAGRATPQEAADVIDPVCGMTVRVATARHRSDWAGRSVYFCCARCKGTFEADPTRYVA
jgi:xanthine dehydrogenase accessory factor